jgi:YfiH family protein
MTKAITKNRKPSQKHRRTSANQRPAKNPAWKLRAAGGLQILEVPALAKLDWLVHGFSTKPGGASHLPAHGPEGARSPARLAKNSRTKKSRLLNLGFTDWDVRTQVEDNRRKFFHAIGADKLRPVMLRQIHSDLGHCVDSAKVPVKEAPKGDALFTRDRGFLLTIQTADCIPILLVDKKRRAIAAVHSGWRGTLHRIAAKTLGRMRMEFGTEPEDVIAALGPGIGRCCYEVGHDVASEFQAMFPNAAEWFDGQFDVVAAGDTDSNWLPWLTMKPPGHAPPPPRVNLDLIAANRAIFAKAGVPVRHIFSSGFCTACRPDLFFSYRRERTTGRMIAAIGIR